VRWVAAAAGLVVVAALLVAVGRRERSGWVDRENGAIARIRAAVGPLDNPSLDAFREHYDFRCLAWRRGGTVYALELCFDGSGRVIEALDRRAQPRLVYGSLRAEPSAARTRIDPALADRLLRRLEAPR
jgi:hypothetical protein